MSCGPHESLGAAFPDLPREEIRKRVEAHNRNPAVRCRRYIAPLVHGELMLWRLHRRKTNR